MSEPLLTNKRIFPRYRADLDCDLLLAGKPLRVRLTDYSLGGISFISKDLPQIDSETFPIKLNLLNIDADAKMVWSEDIFSGKKIGIQKLGALKGCIRKYRLSDMLIGVQKLGKTGVFELLTDSATKKIFFKEGDAIFSSSDQHEERMGDMLVAVKKITPEQYEEAVTIMKKTGKRIGALLVELGYLAPADLIWAVRYQVEKIILNMFSLSEGNFLFKEEPLPIEELITLKLSTGNLIYRGVKSIENIERIKKTAPNSESILYFSPDPASLFQEISLDENDRKILALIDGKRTLRDIIADSPLSEPETLKTIFALYNTQLIEVVEKGMVQPVIATEDFLEKPAPEIDSVMVEKIEKLYREYKSLGYYGVLDISRNAAPDEIKRAYYKIAKELHPDRHLHFQSDTLKGKLNTIFAYVNEAYRVLMQQKNNKLTAQAAPDSTEYRAPEDNQTTAKIRFQEGLQYLNARSYEQALTLLSQAAYLDKSVADYHYYYGIALLKSKRIKDAEESIKKAIEIDPYNADYSAELGEIYLSLGFRTRAKNAFEKAVKYSPSHEKASSGLRKLESGSETNP